MRSSHGAQETAGAGPGGGVLLAVDLPHVLLVVEYLLVPAPRPVLHVGQGPDPGPHLEVHLLVVNLYISSSWLVVNVLLAADPGVDGVPVELPVLYLDLPAPGLVSGLLQGPHPGPNVPAELPLLYLEEAGHYHAHQHTPYLLVAAGGDVAGVDVDRPGGDVPVELPVLDLDLAPAGRVGGVGQRTNLG